MLTVREVHHDSSGQSTQHSFIQIEGPDNQMRGEEKGRDRWMDEWNKGRDG